MDELLFLKLGGSLITDKTGYEAMRQQVLARLAREISLALAARPGVQLLLGHGSGSFGHIPAAKYGTRKWVQTAEQWHGFAEVSAAAARLNRLVTEALLDEGVPAVSLQPSASTKCVGGSIKSMATTPIRAALDAGLVPVIYGDVAFDSAKGGTIISTEEIMTYLTAEFQPSWLLLAGETDGVYDAKKQVIPTITNANFDSLGSVLGKSRGTDVTGGMASKVREMLALVRAHPHLTIRIFSGLESGALQEILRHPEAGGGTVIRC
jgi:isopentenyl phosphate kinase